MPCPHLLWRADCPAFRRARLMPLASHHTKGCPRRKLAPALSLPSQSPSPGFPLLFLFLTLLRPLSLPLSFFSLLLPSPSSLSIVPLLLPLCVSVSLWQILLLFPRSAHKKNARKTTLRAAFFHVAAASLRLANGQPAHLAFAQPLPPCLVLVLPCEPSNLPPAGRFERVLNELSKSLLAISQVRLP